MSSPHSESFPSGRKMRWWMPALIMVTAGAMVGYLHLANDLDNGSRFFFSILTGQVTVLLMTIWYIFFTGLRWRTRLLLTGLAVLIVLAGINTLRVDGANGDMRMR